LSLASFELRLGCGHVVSSDTHLAAPWLT
jgi:hypothetical protein